MWRKLIHPVSFDLRISAGLLLVRLVVGLALVLHGWGKIQNPFSWMGPASGVPSILQALAALSEVGGGIAWMLGVLTPLASFGILCTMAVAAATHIGRGDPFVGKGGPSYELALVYFAVSVLLLLAGPGLLSVDALLARRRKA